MINIIGNHMSASRGITSAQLANFFASRVETDGGVTESLSCMQASINSLRSSGLWGKASAVWLPHGYKEGILYATKGGSSADFTFLRAGTRTRKGPSYIEQVPYNLQGYSERLDTGWNTANGVTITPNATIAPDGTMTADKLSPTTATTQHFAYTGPSGQPGATFTFEVKAKRAESRYFALLVSDNSIVKYSVFDLELGTTGTQSGLASRSIEPHPNGNGWYICKITVSPVVSLVSCQLRNVGDDGSSLTFAGGGTSSGVYLWGAMGTVVPDKAYFHTTDRQNVPALDYTNDTCPAWSLEPPRTNLLLHSEDFSAANWGKADVTVTTNSIEGPDALTTADLITNSLGTTSEIAQNLTIAANGTYTFSGYFKYSNNQFLQVRFCHPTLVNEAVIAWFNPLTGAVLSTQNSGTGTGASASSETILDEDGVATGWYRFILTGAINGGYTTGRVFIRVTNSTNSSTSPGQAYYATGMQLEAGSYATSYIPTTTGSAPRVTETVIGLNPEHTNIALQSETFDNPSWTKDRTTIGINAIMSPTGTLTADKLVEDTALGVHRTYQIIAGVKAAKTYTFSVHVKAAERTKIYMTETTDSPLVSFDLSTLFVSSTKGNIEDLGDGWYRCSLQWITTDTQAVCQIGLYNESSATSYTGDGVSGVYLWGVQFEEGEVATTYLPTTTTPVHDGSVIGQTEGTIYFEGSSFADGTNKQITLSDGTTSNRIVLAFQAGNVIELNIITGGVSTASITTPFTSGTNYKIAATYGPNGAKLTVNGNKIGEDLSITLPPMSRIGFDHGGGSTPFYGYIKKFAIAPIAIVDSEAVTATL